MDLDIRWGSGEHTEYFILHSSYVQLVFMIRKNPTDFLKIYSAYVIVILALKRLMLTLKELLVCVASIATSLTQ